MSIQIVTNHAAHAQISELDRGFQYGDGLFETIAVFNGKACQLDLHINRLQRGLERLHFNNPDLQTIVKHLHEQAGVIQNGVLKLVISRGNSASGYAFDDQIIPNIVITSRAMQLDKHLNLTEGLNLCFCETPVSINRYTAGLKHLNRLDQVLAKAEVDKNVFDDGLMINEMDHVIEATSANLFLLKNQQLITPDLSLGGIAGIAREIVLLTAEELGIPYEIKPVSKQDCLTADGLMLCNSLKPVRLVSQLQETSYELKNWPENLIQLIIKNVFSA